MLVASGLYRFLRNPMYVSLLIIVSGQALLFGQARLFAYAGAILVAFHLFVRFYEERILRRRFGGSYETYLPVRGSMVATSDTVARVSYVSLLTTAVMVALAAKSVLCRDALGGGEIDAARFFAIRLLSGRCLRRSCCAVETLK